MPEWVNSGCIYKNLIRLSPYFSVAEAVCCSQEWCWICRTPNLHSFPLTTNGPFHIWDFVSWVIAVRQTHKKKQKQKNNDNCGKDICSDLVSSGTLLLRTQLSCSCTDSGVVGPSPVPGVGAWMGLRPPLRVFLFRLLADWWDKDWWLCGGGRGGRSVDWLWWLAAPAGRQTKALLVIQPLWFDNK